MPNTHCLPTGSLGTGELPVPNVGTGVIYTIPATTGVGNRRGVVVLLSGLTDAPIPIPPPPPTGDFLTFCNDLAADGWTSILVPYAEDFYDGFGSQGVYNDISNDAGNGSRYLAQRLRWWDHIILYCQATYPGWPVVAFGLSWGGMAALQVAANKANTIIAYGSYVPATLVENANPVLTTPVNFGLLNTSGMDISTTMLNNVVIPGAIGYGTTDIAVGYGGTTTVAAGSAGTPASAVTTLSVASNANMTIGPSVTVTGLTGGTGRATFAFTGLGSSTLTTVTLISGSGTLALGNPVVQSETLALIAAQQAAQPSNQVTVFATTADHLWTPTATTDFTGWFTSTVDHLAPEKF